MTYRADKLKWGKFRILISVWPWMSWSTIPQNNRDLNQGLFFLSLLQIWWSKLNQLISYRADKLLIEGLTDTDTDGHKSNNNTQRPKLASGKNGRQVIAKSCSIGVLKSTPVSWNCCRIMGFSDYGVYIDNEAIDWIIVLLPCHIVWSCQGTRIVSGVTIWILGTKIASGVTIWI